MTHRYFRRGQKLAGETLFHGQGGFAGIIRVQLARQVTRDRGLAFVDLEGSEKRDQRSLVVGRQL